jgi:hypothetical protein
MKPLVLLLTLLAFAFATPAAATTLIPFGDIGSGGTGCPDGTATIVTNDERSSASLILGDYAVGDGRRPLDRQTCAVAIPISVPDGVMVAIRAVGVMGTVDLPEGLDATLGLEAFVAGDSGIPVELTLTGQRSGNWYRAIVIRPDDLVWTGCGEDATLRVNTSLRTRGNSGAKVTLDALTLYRFATKAC